MPHKGTIPWNKWHRTPNNKCSICDKELSNRSAKKCKKCSNKNSRVSFKGRKHTEETKKKIGLKSIGRQANWKDGRSLGKKYMSWQKNKRNRLKGYLNKIGYGHTFGDWELLKKQYGYTCPCCHKIEPEIKLTEDHVIPLSKGGTDLIENIQPLCLKCNMIKHTKIIKF
jgi:5-methylcytosine-specific restriction endonuclease McrA